MTGSANKRVLLADPMGTRGGEERIVVELARRLPERGYDVALACNSAGPLLEELGPGTEVFHVDFNSGEWAAANATWRAIQTWKPHLVHCHGTRPGVSARAAAVFSRCPALWTVHLNPLWGPTLAESRVARVAYRTSLAGLNLCSGPTVCVSGALADELQRFARPFPMRCEVIHNGVDTDHYQPDPRRREECREELGVAKEQILAVMVARLTERKGIEQFMRALSLTSDKQVVGMVAGEGDDRKRLEALYIELELGSRFKFLGELADPRSLLAAADLGVLPSRGEGLPLCVMEMLSSGLPVAVSDIPEHAAFSSLSDAVSTFSLGSAEELGSLFDLGQVWREPARRDHARAQAVERFGFDRMLEEYIQAYERTMR